MIAVLARRTAVFPVHDGDVFPGRRARAIEKHRGIRSVFSGVRSRGRAIDVNVLEVIAHDVVFGVHVQEAQAVAELVCAGRLDRAQGARIADERGLDGIGRPLPRRSVVEDHVGLVHVDVVAEEPVAGPVRIRDRRRPGENGARPAPHLVLPIVAADASGIHGDGVAEVAGVAIELVDGVLDAVLPVARRKADRAGVDGLAVRVELDRVAETGVVAECER
jgi:hypothetical protein